MGLDYQKHKELTRHNIATEGLSQQEVDVKRYDSATKRLDTGIKQQEADTKSYVASFEPQKVAVSQQQADAQTSQANTASGRLALDTNYREREQLVDESKARSQDRSSRASTVQAAAAKNQAETARTRADNEAIKFENDMVLKLIDYLSTGTKAGTAAKLLGNNDLTSSIEAFNALMSGSNGQALLSALTKLLSK